MTAEHVDCFKYASKEHTVIVIEDIGDWWQFLITESTPFTLQVAYENKKYEYV